MFCCTNLHFILTMGPISLYNATVTLSNQTILSTILYLVEQNIKISYACVNYRPTYYLQLKTFLLCDHQQLLLVKKLWKPSVHFLTNNKRQAYRMNLATTR